MTDKEWIMLITMGVYMVAMVAIGVYYSRKNKNTDDYFLGGRKLGPVVTAMSAEASDMSGWLLMGLPGVAYACGIAEAPWTAIGLAIGTYLNWLLVAKRLRRYTVVADNSITLPDFFSNRFKDKSKILMCVSAVIILIFFVPYTASGFSTCGKLFSSLFGVDYQIAMIISAVVIVAYTAIGGFLAASTTDLVQGILMSMALVVVLVFGVSVAGGWNAVIENAQTLPGYLDMFKGYDYKTGTAGSYGFLPVVSTLAWGLGYFGMPAILLRFMAIRDEKELKFSRRIASVWVVISLAVAVLIGVVGMTAVSRSTMVYQAADGTWVNNSESIIVELSKLLAEHGWLAAIFGGLILAGIMAATMSTADSQMLAASSAAAQNFFKGKLCPYASNRVTMLVARGGVIVIAVIAVFIALDPNSSIFRIVSFAWAGFGAAFGPVVLFSLFWKRCNKWGALAGMVTGGAMVFIWKFLISPLGGLWSIYELLPAFILASLALVAVSLMSKVPDQEILDEFQLAASKVPLEEIAGE